jgi:hypothetical protein
VRATCRCWRYGADNGRIAHIILLSTALSFVSFSALATLFDHLRTA